jgi:hypothetical protein
MKKTFKEVASHVTFCRSCGSGFSPYDERVYGAMLLAYERGADFTALYQAEDHKGDLLLYFKKSKYAYGVPVKDMQIMANAWADYTGCELYENVQIVVVK